MFALLNDSRDAVLRYPVPDIGRWLQKALGVTYSAGIDIESVTGGRVVKVHPTDQPADSHQYRIIETTPAFDGTRWVQQWQTVLLDSERQTGKLLDAKRALWDRTEQISQALRDRNYPTPVGDYPLSGNGLVRISLYAANPGPRVVRLKNNAAGIPQYVAATGPQVAGLVSGVIDYLDAITANEHRIQRAIIAAADFDELRAVDVTAGWPT